MMGVNVVESPIPYTPIPHTPIPHPPKKKTQGFVRFGVAVEIGIAVLLIAPPMADKIKIYFPFSPLSFPHPPPPPPPPKKLFFTWSVEVQ